MTADFFSQPILNSPYEYPGCHWELDKTGQPRTAPDSPPPGRQLKCGQRHHQWSQPADALVSAQNTGDPLAAREELCGGEFPVPQAAADVCRRRLP